MPKLVKYSSILIFFSYFLTFYKNNIFSTKNNQSHIFLLIDLKNFRFILTFVKENKNMSIQDLEKWIEEENQDLDKSMFNGITKELKEYLTTLKE